MSSYAVRQVEVTAFTLLDVNPSPAKNATSYLVANAIPHLLTVLQLVIATYWFFQFWLSSGIRDRELN